MCLTYQLTVIGIGSNLQGKKKSEQFQNERPICGLFGGGGGVGGGGGGGGTAATFTETVEHGLLGRMSANVVSETSE